jgi:peptidoglycan-associated lipoprotein
MYNRSLGRKRAYAVRNYLMRLGIKSSRLTVVSYGFERPLNPGHDEAAWAENRRAVPVLSSQHLTQN